MVLQKTRCFTLSDVDNNNNTPRMLYVYVCEHVCTVNNDLFQLNNNNNNKNRKNMLYMSKNFLICNFFSFQVLHSHQTVM
jgi:hypothetical protein